MKRQLIISLMFAVHIYTFNKEWYKDSQPIYTDKRETEVFVFWIVRVMIMFLRHLFSSSYWFPPVVYTVEPIGTCLFTWYGIWCRSVLAIEMSWTFEVALGLMMWGFCHWKIRLHFCFGKQVSTEPIDKHFE